MTDEAFRRFLTETLGAAASVSRNGAVHFVCMDWRHMNFGGLEIDPAYVDVAIDRWSTMTGGTPRLAERRKAA